VNPTYRDIRLPDNDRILAAVGAHYQATQNVGLDLGYMHIFSKDSPINVSTVTGAQVSTTVGTGTLNANLVGVQMSMKFS
jgi:long-chain fatty acid transport protein